MDARALAGTTPSMPVDALPVPIVAQETDYSCGAAALLALMQYWGVDQGLSETDLHDDLETTKKDGTPPFAMAEEATARGLKSNYRGDVTSEDLRDALTVGVTVILDIQADEPEDEDSGHYVVLVGMDGENAYVMDPSSGGSYAWLPLDELDARWHDERDHGAVFVEGTTVAAPPLGAVELERL